jgi:hypothetical protein
MSINGAHFDTNAVAHHAERDALPQVGTLSIMARAAAATIGQERWLQAINKARGYFASKGVIGWVPDDATTLLDVCPLPEPYTGQWGYRLSFACQKGKEVLVIKQFTPAQELGL